MSFSAFMEIHQKGDTFEVHTGCKMDWRFLRIAKSVHLRGTPFVSKNVIEVVKVLRHAQRSVPKLTLHHAESNK